MISSASVRPQNTPLSWIDAVEADGRIAVTPKANAPNAGVWLAADPTAGAATLDRICGEVHIAADSKVVADELDLTASMRMIGFDGTCRRRMIQIAGLFLIL